MLMTTPKIKSDRQRPHLSGFLHYYDEPVNSFADKAHKFLSFDTIKHESSYTLKNLCERRNNFSSLYTRFNLNGYIPHELNSGNTKTTSLDVLGDIATRARDNLHSDIPEYRTITICQHN